MLECMFCSECMYERSQVPLLMPIQLLSSARTAASKVGLAQLPVAAHSSASSSSLVRHSAPETSPESAAHENAAGHSQNGNSNAGLHEAEHAQWAAAIPSIVLISVPGSGWASGIVMSKDGFILTNAHVVQPRAAQLQSTSSHANNSSPSPVKVRLNGSNSWHMADTVYIFKHVLDLAVLKMRAAPDSLRLQLAVLQPHSVSVGQSVAVVGHALFSPSSCMQPSLTFGNISKVTRCSLSASALLASQNSIANHDVSRNV